MRTGVLNELEVFRVITTVSGWNLALSYGDGQTENNLKIHVLTSEEAGKIYLFYWKTKLSLIFSEF